MNDFIGAIKLALTMPKAKQTLIIGAICTLLGVVVMFVNEEAIFMGGILTVYGWLFFLNFMSQLECSQLVLASRLRKKIAVLYPTIITAFGAVFSVAIVWIITSVKGYEDGVMFFYVMLAVFLVYFGGSYKSYWLSTILMVVLAGVLGAFSFMASRNGLSILSQHILGSCFVLGGVIVGGIVRYALRNKPLSDIIVKGVQRQAR